MWKKAGWLSSIIPTTLAEDLGENMHGRFCFNISLYYLDFRYIILFIIRSITKIPKLILASDWYQHCEIITTFYCSFPSPQWLPTLTTLNETYDCWWLMQIVEERKWRSSFQCYLLHSSLLKTNYFCGLSDSVLVPAVLVLHCNGFRSCCSTRAQRTAEDFLLQTTAAED